MPVNIYSAYTMLEMIVLRQVPPEFLRKTFWWRENQCHSTKEFLIEIKKMGRGLACFVNPIREGKVIDDEGFESFMLNPPYTKEKKITTAQKVLQRTAGENVWSRNPMSPQEKAAKKLGEDLAILDDRLIRLEEKMCAEALFYGRVTVVGEGVNAVIDFRFNDSHKIPLTGTDAWSDTANSDPWMDLWDAQKQILKSGGPAPTHAILGVTAAENLLKNAKVKQYLDNRRIELGQIDPAKLPSGATYLGRHNLAGMDLWLYNAWYTDQAGNVQSMVPLKRVAIGTPNAQLDFHYGVIEDEEAIEAGAFAVERYPSSWVEKEIGRWVSMQSAPLPVIHEPDGFAILITEPEE